MVSKKTRFHIFKRDNFRCQYCGRSSDETVLELDHLVPKSKGGTNDEDNLITSCRLCNNQKSDHEIVENIYTNEKTVIPDIDYEPCIITIEFKSRLYNKKIELLPDSVLGDVPYVTNKERFFYSILSFMNMSSWETLNRYLDLQSEICNSDLPTNLLGCRPVFSKESELEIWHKICDLDKSAKAKKDTYKYETMKHGPRNNKTRISTK